MIDRYLKPSIEVVSFDIFDTVITRNVFQPLDLYARVERRLMALAGPSAPVSGTVRRFPAMRIAAESKARERLKEREEVTFDEIVALLAPEIPHIGPAASTLASLEINEELKAVLPVKSTLNLIGQMRRAGKKIVYLSDMYLPEKVIREMLQRAGALEPGDRLFLSGSVGKKKSTGSLFRVVLDQLAISPNQMIHVGDYLWSDYLMPRFKFGICSLPVRSARANVYEHLWGDDCGCPCCRSIAGASRAARVSRIDAGSVEQSAFYSIGCNVIGPLVAHFVLWVLQQAQREGVKRLYFLARDGDLLLESARHLAAHSGIEIDLRYLLVSRTSVFPALASCSDDVNTLKWVKENNIALTLRIIAERLKVDVVALSDGLTAAGLSPGPIDTPMSRGALERLYQALVNKPALKQLVLESGLNAYRALTGYLEQEGLFDGTTAAVVDLGWHGSIQEVIHACYRDRFGQGGLAGYYFGVDRYGQDDCRKRGFFFEPASGVDARYLHLFRILMEVLCAAPSGMVHHYDRSEDGCYHAVTLAVEHPENINSIEQIRCGNRAFLDLMDKTFAAGADFTHARGQVLSVLLKLYLYPSREEATALGEMRFSADQAGNGVHRVAPPFMAGTALGYLTKRSYADRSTISSWFFASWVRSKWGIRGLLYPVVALLRVRYASLLMLRLAKLRAVDFINRVISIT